MQVIGYLAQISNNGTVVRQSEVVPALGQEQGGVEEAARRPQAGVGAIANAEDRRRRIIEAKQNVWQRTPSTKISRPSAREHDLSSD